MTPAALLAGVAAALEALGEELLAWRAAGATSGQWQGPQYKAEADARAHHRLAEALRALTPDVPVLSEEDEAGHDGARPARHWLIDPIDGTASWAGGFAGFVTQAALMDGEAVALSAVRAPALGLTYAALPGGGATLNGAPLHAARPAGRRLLVDNYPEPRGIAAAAMTELGCTGYVESGSLALKMLRVADGTADLFIKDVVVRDWDMAAPSLIVAEAGAAFLRLDGSRWRFAGAMEKPGGIVTAANAAEAARVVAWAAGRRDS